MKTSSAILTLEDIRQRLSASGLLVATSGGPGAVTAVSADSRAVTDGSLFVAIRGNATDGHRFVDDAIRAGAAALVVEAAVGPLAVPTIQVSNARRALAEIGALRAGDPGRKMAVTAVTGTNGKTTTAWVLAQAMNAAGRRCAYVGTIGYGMPDQLREASHTTPDPVVLQEELAGFVAEGCTACAMEASSHALDQHRTDAIDFRTAVFTNLSRDHLDYHGTEERYLDAKARLFEELDPTGVTVTNIDDPAGSTIAQRASGRVVSYGREPSADITFTVRSHQGGLRLRLDGMDAGFQLSGSFNAYNLAAAYAAMRSQDFEAKEAIEALAQARPAPGRFEIIRLGRDRLAIIDFAHTPDALANVLRAARGIVPAGANLWCVFGCGGNRDTGKRPQMGAIAEELSDRVVVTSDNPRTEDPEAILAAIRKGVKDPSRMQWIVDRRTAIRRAVQSAGVGDIVVVAGKGPEPYQIIGDQKLPYQDEAEVRAAAGV